MSTGTVVIEVHGLGKRYRIGARINRFPTLRGAIAEKFTTGPVVRSTATTQEGDHVFWALRDVSFEVRPEEIVGIIGNNGAGKSTLLRVLSRVTTPTVGEALIRGRLGSLLEIGTGFHPELTGRENIFLNGAVLGMRRAEIARKFDEILAFAEVERFVDTPVKHYSSGMYLRLAFAVAAHLETEILMVDEVLAVGDTSFQRKCLGKMREVAGGGRTVLFVSHNLDAVRRLCTRALLIENGMLAADGDVRTIIARYQSALRSVSHAGTAIDLRGLARTGSGELRFASATYGTGAQSSLAQPHTAGPLIVDLTVVSSEQHSLSSLAVTLYDQVGTKLINADTIALGVVLELIPGDNHIRVSIDSIALTPGEYVVGLWAADSTGRPFDHIESAFMIEVVSPDERDRGVAESFGLVACRFSVESL